MKDVASLPSPLFALVLAGALLATSPSHAQQAPPAATPAPAPAAAATANAAAVPTPAAASASDAESTAWQKKQDDRLARGDALLKDKQAEAAISEAFDPIIQDFEARYAHDGKRYYSARTSTETLFYMLSVASDNDKGVAKQDGVALGSTWAYAHYGKAYALVDLNRLEEAVKEIDLALQLAPLNPQFLSERAYLYRSTSEWDKMLEGYRSALSYIDMATPDNLKSSERARALRGEGYALIELGDLDLAEKSFKKSLKLEPRNEMALGELVYIKQLRKKKK